MEWLRSRIRRSPRFALVLGKIVFLAGAILILSAVFGRAGLLATNTERAQAKLPALQTLGAAYPQYPTWLVPESPVGFSIAAVLVLVGMALTVLAAERVKERGRG
jgi:hypothetical protein